MNPTPPFNGAPAPQQQGTPLPLGGEISFATLNCNGLMTVIDEGSK